MSDIYGMSDGIEHYWEKIKYRERGVRMEDWGVRNFLFSNRGVY